MNKSKDGSNGRFLKILMLGDSGVGKTSLIRLYSQNIVQSHTPPTVGLDITSIDDTLKDGTKVCFLIFDTAGQEKFRSMAKTNYRHASGVVFVFAINDRNSFANVKKWVKDLKEINDTSSCILVGNKADIDKRVVTFSEGQALASDLGCLYFETSIFDAKRPPNALRINDIYRKLGDIVVTRLKELDIDREKEQSHFKLSDVPVTNQGRCGRC